MSDTLKRHIRSFLQLSKPSHLAQLSGLRENHIRDYKNGVIKAPHKNIVLKLCIALELSLEKINMVLNEFDIPSIDPLTDIGSFQEAIVNRRIPPGVHPLKPDPIIFEIEIMSIEKLAGDVKLVTSSPHRVFDQSAKYEEDLNGKDEIYKQLRESLLNLRKKNFMQAIKMYETHHLICVECLREYIKSQRKRAHPQLKDILIEMVEVAIDSNNKYKLDLISKCPNFQIHLQEPTHGSVDKPVSLFAARGSVHRKKGGDKLNNDQLFGFLSTDKSLYKYFINEFNLLTESIVRQSRTPEKLKEYIFQMLK